MILIYSSIITPWKLNSVIYQGYLGRKRFSLIPLTPDLRAISPCNRAVTPSVSIVLLRIGKIYFCKQHRKQSSGSVHVEDILVADKLFELTYQGCSRLIG